MRAAVLLLFGLSAAAASATPLQPTGKWEVQYSDSACTAKRAFGDYNLLFQPSPFGQTVRYVIEGPGKARRDRQHVSVIETANNRPAIKVSSLLYPLSEKNRRALYLVLSKADSDQVLGDGSLHILAGDPVKKELTGLPSAPERMSVELAIGSTAALQKALGTCLDDLRKAWGIVDGKPIGDVDFAKRITGAKPLFTPDDYPADAMANNQKGTTHYLLMIDETGRLLDCVVEVSSGVASLDAMGCQAMLQRAKFIPATDETGKPRKAIQRFTLSWRIAY